MNLTAIRLGIASVALGGAIVATLALDGHLIATATPVMLAFLLSAALLLPRLAAAAVFALCLATAWLWHTANAEKLALTRLPLTSLDLSIALNDPLTTLSAASIPVAGQYAILIAAATVGLAIVMSLGRPTLQLYRRSAKAFAIAALCTIALAACWWFGARHFVRAVAAEVATVTSQGDFARNQWDPNGVAQLSQTVGLLPFLIHTYFVEDDGEGTPWMSGSSNLPPPSQEIDLSIDRHLELKPIPEEKLPNVAIVLMESTFDPNALFDLATPLKMEILDRQLQTQLLAPMTVTAAGGGTWISEFEMLTGLNSKLFGYWGYYTHTSLGPYVRRTIASYFADRGYATSGFYPTSGSFYNAGKAYIQYGFQTFIDGVELGLGEAWRKSDTVVMDAFIKRHSQLHRHDRGPFFSMFVTVENHAPHPCEQFKDASQFATTFRKPVEFGMNCQLNEYIVRLRRTSQGISNLRTYLEAEQARTGRPYVIMAFGDHLPHTFVSSGGAKMSPYRYETLRRGGELHTTFVHIMGTAPAILKSEPAEIPITLLPTLLSGFVSGKASELYLPVSFLLLDRCGAKTISVAPSKAADAEVGRGCRQALASTIASYKRADIIALP